MVGVVGDALEGLRQAAERPAQCPSRQLDPSRAIGTEAPDLAREWVDRRWQESFAARVDVAFADRDEPDRSRAVGTGALGVELGSAHQPTDVTQDLRLDRRRPPVTG